MVLGKQADEENQVPLSGTMAGMDTALSALYEQVQDRKGGLGSSSPSINRWLGDIRKYFPTSVVQVMQRDALERLGIEKMLLEPELLGSLTPDVHLVATLLSLNKIMPEKTRETAREVIRKVVQDLEKRLKMPLQQAINSALNRSVRNRRPKLNEINWHATIRANLKHYQPDYQTIIPHDLHGYGRKGQALRDVILLVDQSASMGASMVYASIAAAVMASIRSIKTSFIVFDTAVVDLTPVLHDPIDVLFGTQLGGGTDINKALTYTETRIKRPADTILILISDLYEGGAASPMIRRLENIKASGVQVISLLALSDEGTPAYDKEVAARLAAINIPVFACTPDKFADLMAKAIKKD
jgi:Mg-chelatase subunit ChlD